VPDRSPRVNQELTSKSWRNRVIWRSGDRVI
jgi:hypothetical protein